MQVFGSSGVRGVANEELTPAYVMQIAQAAGSVLEAERVALARDTRTTGQQFADAAASGLASVGCDVDRLGELPTPALQAYCDREGVPGLMVTASHNPPAYNGVKLVGADGVELERATLDRIEAALATEASLAAWADVGRTSAVDGAADDYVEEVLAAVDREAVANADLTVVVDPGHGAGCHTSPDFLRELGCEVHTVHAQPDGTFPGRDPEPVADNLAALCDHVIATDADLGIAHDGDADRAMFVDETGEVIDGDAALAALVEAAVEPGDAVVSAVNASQQLRDVVEAADAELTLTQIGSTNIVTRVRELQAEGERVAVAGEGNGGVIFPDYRIARDGAYTAARFLELVAERPATEIVDEHDRYVAVRQSVGYADEGERAAMLSAVERVAEEAVADLDTTDGYRLEYGDGWVLARPSGTEPVVRVYAEARTEQRAGELADQFGDAVRDARGD
ncbi:phosphoglucosamine mutase [Halomicrobium salinisoli]|uniref:phosphoglucosamine mutase n=1 Tax=Halomicrobium salinisoli TaxID=2878391 RepID=UPI001CF064B3|nr:phosphoglucosamine mutase [Halomicrobium salinisoli]